MKSFFLSVKMDHSIEIDGATFVSYAEMEINSKLRKVIILNDHNHMAFVNACGGQKCLELNEEVNYEVKCLYITRLLSDLFKVNRDPESKVDFLVEIEYPLGDDTSSKISKRTLNRHVLNFLSTETPPKTFLVDVRNTFYDCFSKSPQCKYPWVIFDNIDIRNAGILAKSDIGTIDTNRINLDDYIIERPFKPFYEASKIIPEIAKSLIFGALSQELQSNLDHIYNQLTAIMLAIVKPALKLSKTHLFEGILEAIINSDDYEAVAGLYYDQYSSLAQQELEEIKPNEQVKTYFDILMAEIRGCFYQTELMSQDFQGYHIVGGQLEKLAQTDPQMSENIKNAVMDGLPAEYQELYDWDGYRNTASEFRVSFLMDLVDFYRLFSRFISSINNQSPITTIYNYAKKLADKAQEIAIDKVQMTYFKLGAITAYPMDAYLLAKLFREYDDNGDDISTSIIYCGTLHTYRYIGFLKWLGIYVKHTSTSLDGCGTIESSTLKPYI